MAKKKVKNKSVKSKTSTAKRKKHGPREPVHKSKETEPPDVVDLDTAIEEEKIEDEVDEIGIEIKEDKEEGF
jgi:hypothetical protein